MAKEKIDLEKFFTDPAYAEEKDFLTGVIERHLSDKAAKAKADQDAKDAADLASGQGKTFLQSIFDGK